MWRRASAYAEFSTQFADRVTCLKTFSSFALCSKTLRGGGGELRLQPAETAFFFSCGVVDNESFVGKIQHPRIRDHSAIASPGPLDDSSEGVVHEVLVAACVKSGFYQCLAELVHRFSYRCFDRIVHHRYLRPLLPQPETGKLL